MTETHKATHTTTTPAAVADASSPSASPPLPAAFTAMLDEAIDKGTSDFDKFEKLIVWMGQQCGKDGAITASTYSHRPWDRVMERIGFTGKDAYRAILESFYLQWWNAFTEDQLRCAVTTGERYRATASYAIAHNRFLSRDRESSVRWALLTQIADALSGHTGGGARHHLLASHGFSNSLIDVIDESCRGIAARVQSGDDFWSSVYLAPEVVLLDFLVDSRFRPYLFGGSNRPEHEINPSILKRLMDEAFANSNTNNEKGAKLEILVSYLASLLPGYFQQRNILDVDSVSEHDVVAVPTSFSRPVIEGFGGPILFEAKNWSDPVNVEVLGYLATRMQLTGATVGVIVSREGITGANEKAAHGLVRRVFHSSGLLILTLARADLEKMLSSASSLTSHLQERYEEFIFGKQRKMPKVKSASTPTGEKPNENTAAAGKTAEEQKEKEKATTK